MPPSKTSKNAAVLHSFIEYCFNHPEERFWQALRNWSNVDCIQVREALNGTIDTFHWEGKNG